MHQGLQHLCLAAGGQIVEHAQVAGQKRCHRRQGTAAAGLPLPGELLPPPPQSVQAVVEEAQELPAVSLPGQHGAGGGIEPGGVFEGADVHGLGGFHGAVQHGQGIDACRRHG